TISSFRKDSKKYFDQVIEDQDVLLITRNDGQTIVAMPLAQYTSKKEMDYLLANDANRHHLEQGIEQAKQGHVTTKSLDELAQDELAQSE
ncbi:MAG TPA: type II toxin-antitoxin system Phd/YefM family antitoxin, partial [Candidatus Saccharimonadia bacterium]